MVDARDHAVRVFGQGFEVQGSDPLRAVNAGDHDVELSLDKHSHQRLAEPQFDGDVDSRKLVLERDHRHGNQIGRGRYGGTDGNIPGKARSSSREFLVRLTQLRQCAARMPHQNFTVGRRLDAARMPGEERNAECLFEPRQKLRRRRLRQERGFSGTKHRALFVQMDQQRELPGVEPRAGEPVGRKGRHGIVPVEEVCQKPHTLSRLFHLFGMLRKV